MSNKSLKLWRTFKEGATNFRRNGWLTFATVSILTLSLFIVSLSLLLGVTTNLILQNMREKVSISVSFNPDVPESKILEIQGELSKFTKEIRSVEYVSRDQALKDFLGKNNPVIAKAIDEIGENPLLASLNIKAATPEDYPLIVDQLQKSTFQNDISRINYEENKRIFDRLEHINQATQKSGLAIGITFILIAILITFNTIRITIYSHRQEFEVMRLVGASNLYVRTPFVFEGILYGLTAAFATMILLAAIAYYISPLTEGAIPQGNFLNLYFQNFHFIFLGLVVLGILLGVISSAIAIRRYLKV
ncbi:MAG: permease-like cell division protein FtsX [Candidatus Moraniibacteriota bacterium]